MPIPLPDAPCDHLGLKGWNVGKGGNSESIPQRPKWWFGVFGQNWSLFVKCCPVITHVTQSASNPLARTHEETTLEVGPAVENVCEASMSIHGPA